RPRCPSWPCPSPPPTAPAGRLSSWAAPARSRTTSGNCSPGRPARRSGGWARRPGLPATAGRAPGAAAPRSLVPGFRPSQALTFSPLAATTDGGASWSSGALVSPGLADVPDALAAGPGGQLLALTQGGGAELGARLGASWAKLASAASLARTPAGRACGLTGLTAAAFSGSGAPMLAGRCGRTGTAGIFALTGGRWHAAGPVVPAALTGGTAGRAVEVLRMATLGTRTQTVLESGAGPAATILTAWSNDGGGHWLLSAPLHPGAGGALSASFGTGGGVGLVLAGGRGEALAGPGASWRALPALPRWTATLAVGR